MTAALSTDGPAATFALGVEIGSHLRPGDVLEINGPLGAGKTALAKGIVHGVTGIAADEITSPAYTLVNEHRAEGRPPVFHMDLYRLEHLDGEDLDMFEDYLLDRRAVKVVEWGERFLAQLVPIDLSIAIDYGTDGDDSRSFVLTDVRADDRWADLIRTVTSP